MNARAMFGAAVLLVFACDTADQAKGAADRSREVADDAIAQTKEQIEKTKQVADEARAKTEAAKRALNDISDTGELSATAKSWLDEHADDADGTIESVIVSGEQIAPVAADITKTVSEAVDNERKIEPIYQKIEDGKTEEVDKAIGDMPRTEVIEGLTIGFKRLDETSNEKMVKERGYLITWREGDHLIGLVYRSKRTIDVDKLVAETPRLVALTKTALAG